jgi:hypothetical protein
MGTVFCRGCGKEIHETAPACPQCGAPQWLPPSPGVTRNVAKLIGLGLVSTFVLWFAALFMVGIIAGISNPNDGRAAGQRAGEEYTGLLLLISACVSGGLTFAGLLPGTAKRAPVTRNL